jgi:hypothetical protein
MLEYVSVILKGKKEYEEARKRTREKGQKTQKTQDRKHRTDRKGLKFPFN